MSDALIRIPDQTYGPKELPSVLNGEGSIFVLHPDYNMEFFVIPCFPYPESQPPFVGAHLGLLLDACKIIANNEPGFLGTSTNRTSEIPSDNRDFILSPGKYYYHLYNSIPRYPIVPEFNAWTPPSKLPQHWQNVNKGTNTSASIRGLFDIKSWASISQKIKDADATCAMTRSSSCLNACHLVPSTNEDWFLAHGVHFLLTTAIPNINNPQNVITLRADLIDKGHFVFIPIQGNLTTYFISNGLPEVAHEFHRHRINLPDRTSLECLYYRFAWSIFQSVTRLSSIFRMARLPVPVFAPNSRKIDRQKTIKGGRTATGIDNDGQSSRSGEVDVQGSIDASLLSPSNNGDGGRFGHLLDLSPVYSPVDSPEMIAKLAAQDARIKKEVGAVLDESNIHLLSPYDAQHEWYPGFSDILRLKERYVRENPQVRATNEAVTGRCNDGYESESWGWGDSDGESEEGEKSEEELDGIVSGQLVHTFA